MKIILTGGGTGGHLNIVACLLESALKKGLECIYIGSESGQDKAWFENQAGFIQKHFLSSKGVVNQKGLGKFKSLAHTLKLALKCKEIIRDEDIKAVFSVGGYSAAPASFGAIFNKTPLFIHEQNSKSGSLNKLLKPFSKGFFSAFEPIFCPYPIKPCFFEQARIRKELKTIIFLGGSQGASFINSLALKLAPKLYEMGIQIIHQSGKLEFEKCQNAYKELGINAEVFAFKPNLEQKMKKADLAISRAGASTLFELSANALPTLFIPYPSASKNHQYCNAKFLFDQNLCQIFTQEQAQNETLLLQSILNLKLDLISSKLKAQEYSNGADFMLEYMFKHTLR
ncbi:UDP-N-acetylglucosamine--N-acetylmuramyl-(pentapeptide) pyrophosphoryl-undecaprenol N-acetylglucosamine transferase [Campylobacter sp. MIT 97-5078]|uniref:UDP-N-acetylglucosamine--N-acetylmuramyl- (pentapeptide) pyrophosphoryl-undecaprenol N-acetylglucosamine transferase n=1 Tax=Campylobacter sp. MIT 97-5078 TaxID=1548153 RepID=UPI0005131980|nr:UDP-N-acetylglucosamine--N-acetylmuramyl-(pentapeptide) pyrophosphoryl-undecaprenol N-acetylglucosamine transferase [Campylobacter sp. MIT 97-5078]KGI57291.1 UDP-diphospho-muramoylpentapeptide beta-N-acetylglucosaminyltransferase [Campylobacter sp. MIT 97-5078]TQR28245.1 UDP-N-acetylglucosamine--N-acetylmuramyl-(pentapeptide) pyrophosphoryl-undecaprenol N-acetylglucosamine transferase [Campylobacter sp. MIT 97-5078]